VSYVIGIAGGGAALEMHQRDGGVYNNIPGPVAL
jgi:hypothetical protein